MSEQPPEIVITQEGDATIVVLPPGQSAVYTDGETEQVIAGVLVVEQTPGPRGEQGPPGPQGDQGPVGKTGDPGQDGPPGVRGERGLMGATGKQGKPGPPGIRGEQGKPGPQGRTGDTGRVGDRGPQGIPGKQGETGARGLPGIHGVDGVGIQGEDGLSAFEVARRRGFRGTEAEWIASLRGPQGKQGERGLRGEKGDRGDVGPKGDEGKLGPRGPAGGEGRFGQPGSPGADGPPGPQGPAGPAGVGVPPGGTTGQVLTKASDADYDDIWADGGSGGSSDSEVQTAIAAVDLSGHRCVTTQADGTLIYADNTILSHRGRPLWISTGAILTGAMGTAISHGRIVEPTWSWSPGTVYLGVNGFLTQTPPDFAGGATFLAVVGNAVSATELFVTRYPSIVLAA